MTSVRRLFVKAAVGACALAGLASSGAYAASPEGMKLYQFTSQYFGHRQVGVVECNVGR
jgi:hypothetical protein